MRRNPDDDEYEDEDDAGEAMWEEANLQDDVGYFGYGNDDDEDE